ncbi:MAG: BF3164 family lipoprotein [Gemmatimonadota bacterium]
MNSRRGVIALIGLFTFSVLVLGFREKTDLASLDHAVHSPLRISGRVLPETPELGLPSEIRVAGEHLVVLDRFADLAVHVLRRSSGAYVGGSGREGDGPGEFRAPWNMEIVGEARVGILDLKLQRISWFSLQDYEFAGQQSLKGLGTVTDFVQLPSGDLVAIGSFGGGRLALTDAQGVFKHYAGDLPPSTSNIPTPVLLHAYQSYMESRPDGEYLALVTRHAGWLEIYDQSVISIVRTSGPFPFEPKYEVAQGARGPVMKSGPDLRFGYLDLSATDSRIYSLFSGRLRGAFPDGRAVYGRYVHVFDWEGNLIEVLELSGDTFAIAVDETGSQMYAIEHLPEPRIMVYDLGARSAG